MKNYPKSNTDTAHADTSIEKLPVLMRLMLPAHSESASSFRKKLNDAGCYITQDAHQLLETASFQDAPKSREVELVTLSARSLGFDYDKIKHGTGLYKYICEIAVAHGLELCPPQVGPLLRIQYRNQPPGEHLVLGMQAIPVSAHTSHVFGLSSIAGPMRFLLPGQRQLELRANSDDTYSANDIFVFIRPRKDKGSSEQAPRY
ncbi:MAG: Uncharacterized protein G01um10148_557 [Parcubacteria group bacterium Gr01-1014_8]|nr:MAG: Uncharacterized protein G01um10148_557 [Parcubacteria group bacterium Gr01-1014_8]